MKGTTEMNQKRVATEGKILRVGPGHYNWALMVGAHVLASGRAASQAAAADAMMRAKRGSA